MMLSEVGDIEQGPNIQLDNGMNWSVKSQNLGNPDDVNVQNEPVAQVEEPVNRRDDRSLRHRQVHIFMREEPLYFLF